MRVFPQLATGASALYPLVKHIHRRTVVNALADGQSDKCADGNGGIVAWDLRAIGLTAAEWADIEMLFESTAGSLETFTFLDPVGNLLAESEDLQSPAWLKEGVLALTPGIEDPLGSTRATRIVNAGQADGALVQILGVPGRFQYCLSTWARSTAGARLTLTITASGSEVSDVFALHSEWQRIFVTGRPGLQTEAVSFRIQFEPGAVGDVFGIQAEGQLAPADYMKTGARSGVYSKARFASDQLAATAQGIDSFDAVVRIVNTEP
jgi:hypothetical protein